MSGHGNGKVILLGEHAVVYGVPAIAAGLSSGATAVARAANATAAPTLSIAPWSVSVRPGDGSALGTAFEALVRARRELDPQRATDRSVEATMTLPGSAGLGSSAALGVAVLRALDHADDIARDFAQSQQIALAWERVFHGNPSGIDTALALAGGLARFHRQPAAGQPALVSIEGAPITLVVAHSGASGSTKETVANVAALRASQPEAFAEALAAFGALVHTAERALREGALESLGEAFDEGQTLLRAWGVSTPELDAMCEVARGAGALGAKLTGGGGGGCMIALVRDEHDAERVRSALSVRGREAFETTIGAAHTARKEKT